MSCVTGKMDSDSKSCVCLPVVPSAGEPACKMLPAVQSSSFFAVQCTGPELYITCYTRYVPALNCTLQYVTQGMYIHLVYTERYYIYTSPYII
jgi:hypothetical protein